MKKAEFLQEKATFLVRYPERDELAFYNQFMDKHPDEAIGWLSYGRELEKRGNTAKALEAYRKALHSKHQDGVAGDEVRQAYHTLLRQKKRADLRQRLRQATATLLFLTTLLLSLPWHRANAPKPNVPTASSQQATSAIYPHTEVIAVPENLSQAALDKHVTQYLKTRRPARKEPFTLLAVPAVENMPLYTPLPFYNPTKVRGVLRYDPTKQVLLSRQWYWPSVDTPAMLTKQLAQEQREREQVLIVRSALYRYYQLNGQLPEKLDELAGAYPYNRLATIPNASALTYRPSAFRPDDAWQSVSKVLPFPHYPEPNPALGPLQISVHQASYTMTLMSGPHLVRQYPIGIGRKHSTPEGYFTILEKISRPRGHDNIYGTRGLLFSSPAYAIHGTNNPESIRKAQSLGCIRLYNNHVEELYSFVTPGCEVIISGKKSPLPSWSNPAPFILRAGSEEETPKIVYQWLQ